MEQQRFGQWEGFVPGGWQAEINVRDFIQKNVTPYEGDSTFLSGKTDRTDRLMRKLEQLLSVEQGFGGVLDIDTQEVSSLTAGISGQRGGADRGTADEPPAQERRQSFRRHQDGKKGVRGIRV